MFSIEEVINTQQNLGKWHTTQPKKIQLKALVVKNSVLHDFGFGKVSPAKQL